MGAVAVVEIGFFDGKKEERFFTDLGSAMEHIASVRAVAICAWGSVRVSEIKRYPLAQPCRFGVKRLFMEFEVSIIGGMFNAKRKTKLFVL